MARDPLAALARLRGFALREARRQLAERLAGEALAAARLAAAGEALANEAAGSAPSDYAAWLPRGLAERDRAALALGFAAERTGAARAGVLAARAEARAVERARELSAEAAARAGARRAQAGLDEIAAGRAGRDAPP